MALVALVVSGMFARALADPRTTLSLDGPWEITDGALDRKPDRFDRIVPVPGLADMAQPAFVGVGESNQLREAYWYRKRFRLDDKVPAIARLKVHKAMFGTLVYLNGERIGEHQPCFTPGYFDAHRSLRGQGAYNDLVIRIGASRNAVPSTIPSGWDFEKTRYIPGLFDSVELILSGTPHILNVQVAPDLDHQQVRVRALIANDGKSRELRVEGKVREIRSRRSAGSEKSAPISLSSGEQRAVEWEIPLKDCHRWTPEDPFLYELEVSTGEDELRTRFGMREFRTDPKTGRAMLNGRPYYLRGSNVTLYRFFEDAARGDRPWREDWVRRLHREFKGMHWNTLRYCIGFPPELWYRIADEEGLLIQDEFPIWQLSQWPTELNWEELAREYTEWIQERWNHPCVVIWDAQNETVTPETGKAIQAVRWQDLSRRPWDNGWGAPQMPEDVYESHPYLASDPGFRLPDVQRQSPIPQGHPMPNTSRNPILINEYGWLWLNRDGAPTTLTRDLYGNLLGGGATTEQRRELHARYLAAKTEFWRAHRACAGVLHFCGLGYSRSDGQTSDHFIDVEKLTWEPHFSRYVRDAFAPVGVMVDEWAEDLPPALARKTKIMLVNDLSETWTGSLRFRLLQNKTILQEKMENVVLAGLGTRTLFFDWTVPAVSGRYQLEATLLRPGSPPVSSLRDFDVLSQAQRVARYGWSVDCPITASSEAVDVSESRQAQLAVDGRRETRWASASLLPGQPGAAAISDEAWLKVDLEQGREVSRMVLLWDSAYAKSYTVEISSDGVEWHEAYRTDSGDGRMDVIELKPAAARWVRLGCRKPALPSGYSLWELQVF
jgi:hypothetical protein